MAPPLQRRFVGPRSRVVALTALIAGVILLLSGAGISLGAVLEANGGIPRLLQHVADAIESSLGGMPAWLRQWIPADVDDMRNGASEWLRAHAHELGKATAEAGRVLAHIIIGMAIGAILSLRHATTEPERKPLGAALTERAERFADSFRRVIFAQVRISAINTAATAVYLMVLLPLLGVHLPLRKTLIALTFITGLLPVIGNLLSNAVIVVVSLAQSVYVAIGSLVFLVLIHKLEYLLNAHIVGSRINARAWELLVAMVVMEAAFGLGGLIAAPFYYAYVKRELAERGLV